MVSTKRSERGRCGVDQLLVHSVRHRRICMTRVSRATGRRGILILAWVSIFVRTDHRALFSETGMHLWAMRWAMLLHLRRAACGSTLGNAVRATTLGAVSEEKYSGIPRLKTAQ
ncbi:hypothetical protein P154DRAFT_145029 [Amniculicola lignicola CBS 123094]|uniref:Uncharacterized protein n=1 Tax=Amniculicola lignicola CBS 123094 TaxID=1392246 RepID=A0A6A5WKS3_9PLEO|nr:hypothetical protein P154DRAFT_145029 [Amniculicola lignicola CBS 123094]